MEVCSASTAVNPTLPKLYCILSIYCHFVNRRDSAENTQPPRCLTGI